MSDNSIKKANTLKKYYLRMHHSIESNLIPTIMLPLFTYSIRILVASLTEVHAVK